MTHAEQLERAADDGRIATVCPKCRAIHEFDALALVGKKSHLLECECGTTFTYRGYGKPRQERRRRRRKL